VGNIYLLVLFEDCMKDFLLLQDCKSQTTGS